MNINIIKKELIDQKAANKFINVTGVVIVY